MPRAFELAAAQPWLMQPEALDTLLAVADGMGDPVALEARLGRHLDNSRTVTMRDGVAVVPVVGPIFRYANLFTEISGATSTQVLATDIREALDNPAVKAIVLNIDSPGGVASGINELAEMIHAGRGQKRIVAYIGGTGASGAYWVASAAHEIVIDETGIAGSVGVVVEAVTEGEAANGRKRWQIVSRNAPNKRPDLTTEEGRAKVGETIDALEDVFISKVARNLGVAVQDVPGMGDHGGLRVGAAAVDAGLAHRLGSLESLITELAKPAATYTRKTSMKVSTTADLQAAIAAGTDPQTIEIVQAQQPDVEGIKAEARTEGAKSERERIGGIQALAQKGFETEVQAAINDGLSVEAAGLSLFKAAQDRGVTLAGIKQDATRARAATPPVGDKGAKISVNDIYAARKGGKQ